MEAKPGESIEDMLATAGGTNTLGDPFAESFSIEQPIRRKSARSRSAEPMPLPFRRGGDLLQNSSRRAALSSRSIASLCSVRVEGEVNRPGYYYVAPNTPLHTVMGMAGGLSPRAFAYGTKFTRQSVRLQQQESFKEAISQLELTLAAAPLTANTSQSESERANAVSGARAVLDRLKNAEPDGRVVLDIAPKAVELPANVLLEEQRYDLTCLPRSTTVRRLRRGLYRPASFRSVTVGRCE